MPTPSELMDLAVGHQQRGELAQAEVLCRQVLQVEPRRAAAHHLLGLIAAQAGQTANAIHLLRQAVTLDPADAAGWFNLAILLGKDDLDGAIRCYRHVLRLEPHAFVAQNNLGNALSQQGQWVEAELCYRQALRGNPNLADAQYNLGNVLLQQVKLDEAIASYRQALVIQPRLAEAHNNLGNALQAKGAVEEAIPCYRRALECDPRLAKAHINLGEALGHCGDFGGAQEHHEQALRALPDNTTARWNLAFLQLQRGDLAQGWPGYELRWAFADVPARTFPQPRWDGAHLPGKTILVYAEQGLGDTLQFVRYLPLVKERVAKIVLECQPSLTELCAGASGVDQVVPRGTPLPAFDVHIPLLSLPGIFQTTLATIPATVPYLHADAGRVGRWKEELALGGVKVGIVWQGNPKHKGDCYRSVPLSLFAPLAQVSGLCLVSLQVGPGSEQLAGAGFPVIDLGSRFDPSSLGDLAAALRSLDLVITVETAVAHLAGALHVPVWVPLSVAGEWRWLLDRSDSPWYPSMRLFRQRRLRQWSDVFERIRDDLTSVVATGCLVS